MTEESKEKVLFYIIAGAGIMLFAYLFFKDQFKNQNLSSISLNTLSNAENKKVIELQKQTVELKEQTTELQKQTVELKEQMNAYNYKLENLLSVKSSSFTQHIPSIDINNLEIPKSKLMKAGDVSSIRSTSYDKIRQMKYGML